MKHEPEPPSRWHVGKEIPLALIAGMIFQVGIFVWSLSALSERVSALEKQMVSLQPAAERLVRLETRFDSVLEKLSDIKQLVIERPRMPALIR